MKYREAHCAGDGSGWTECNWTYSVPALTGDIAFKPGYTDGLEQKIEDHIAPTKILNRDGLAWPHMVYVIDVYR